MFVWIKIHICNVYMRNIYPIFGHQDCQYQITNQICSWVYAYGIAYVELRTWKLKNWCIPTSMRMITQGCFFCLRFGQLMVNCWFGARWFGIQTGVQPSNKSSHKGDSRTLKPPIWEVHFMQVSTCPAYEKTAGKLRTFPIGKKESAGNKMAETFPCDLGSMLWMIFGRIK